MNEPTVMVLDPLVSVIGAAGNEIEKVDPAAPVTVNLAAETAVSYTHLDVYKRQAQMTTLQINLHKPTCRLFVRTPGSGWEPCHSLNPH